MAEHKLSDPHRYAYDGKLMKDGIVRITCSCGWAVSHSPGHASALAHGHIERARRFRAGYPPETVSRGVDDNTPGRGFYEEDAPGYDEAS